MLSTKEAQLDTLGIRAKTATGITLSQCVMSLITLQDLRFDMKTRRKERISEHKVTFEDKEIAEYKRKAITKIIDEQFGKIVYSKEVIEIVTAKVFGKEFQRRPILEELVLEDQRVNEQNE